MAEEQQQQQQQQQQLLLQELGDNFDREILSLDTNRTRTNNASLGAYLAATMTRPSKCCRRNIICISMGRGI